MFQLHVLYYNVIEQRGRKKNNYKFVYIENKVMNHIAEVDGTQNFMTSVIDNTLFKFS
jgi:hypothetical protein